MCDYKVNVCVLVIKTSGFVKRTCGERDICECIAKRYFDKKCV
jgi:hypothetical protein